MYAIYEDQMDGTFLMVAGPTKDKARAEELLAQMEAENPHAIYEIWEL